MDNNKTKALAAWSGMDSFWNLVVNKEEINNIWQTMFASVEQLESLYNAYGRLSVINMPNELTLNNVVFTITETSVDKKYITVSDKLLGETSMADIISIPELRTVINSNTVYVEGVDYNLFPDGDSLAIQWLSSMPEDDGTYYAPTLEIENTRIDQFGAMHWDLGLREAGIDTDTRKRIYHSLLLCNKTILTKSSLRNTLNMIAGANFAKYPGKLYAADNPNEIGINYVNSLYLVRHAGNVYGSETETEVSAADISQGLLTDFGATPIESGDIISLTDVPALIIKVDETNAATLDINIAYGRYRVSLDNGVNYVTATIKNNMLTGITDTLEAGDSIIIEKLTAMALSIDDAGAVVLDITLTIGTVDVVCYSSVPILFNECYAIRDDNIYSCLYDNLPDSGPFNVTHSLNYDVTDGYASIGEIFSVAFGDSQFDEGDYVEIYDTINEVVHVYDWQELGETNISDEAFRYDDYIYRNYLQDTRWRYVKGINFSDHDINVGDTLIIEVGYSLELAATSPDSYTLVVPASQPGITDMYGNLIDVTANFKELDTLVVSDGLPGGERCQVTVAYGVYDDLEGSEAFILTTMEEITVTAVASVLQPYMAKHKHLVLEVEPDLELVTDRTQVYGEYREDCSIVARRCNDVNYKTHIYEIADASLTEPEILKLTLTGSQEMQAELNDIAEGTTAIVWSDDINVAHLPVLSIGASDITVDYDPESGILPETFIGATLLYAGGLYNREDIYISSTNTDEDIIAALQELAALMLPEGTIINIIELT